MNKLLNSLQKAYQNCSYGKDKPILIGVSTDNFSKLYEIVIGQEDRDFFEYYFYAKPNKFFLYKYAMVIPISCIGDNMIILWSNCPSPLPVTGQEYHPFDLRQYVLASKFRVHYMFITDLNQV